MYPWLAPGKYGLGKIDVFFGGGWLVEGLNVFAHFFGD